MDNEQEKPAEQTTEPTTPQTLAQPPRIIDVRGELEITVYTPITKEEEDVYTQCELMASVTIDGKAKEGLIVLSVKKTKQLLKLLNLEGV